MIQYGRSSRSSWTESVWSSFRRTVDRTIIREDLFKLAWRKISNWKCLICSLETRIILVGACWRHQNVQKEVEYSVHIEKMMKNIDLKDSTSFFDHVYLWFTQRECKSIEIIVQEYTKKLESRISDDVTENYLAGKSSRKNNCMTLRHGRSCSWKIQWIDK